jgi:hypothetical protein
MPSHQSPHGRIKELPDYSYDDVDYGTMLDMAQGRRFKGSLTAMERDPRYEGLWQELEQEIQDSFNKKDSQFVLNGTWKKFYGKVVGLDIYAVDGDWVRSNLSVIFMHGGHGYVHEFIPQNEIWISTHHPVDCGCEGVSADRRVSANYFKSCTVHEITEFKEMAKGVPYVDAHETANIAEMELGLLPSPEAERYVAKSTSERCYEPSYIPENTYKVEMGAAEKLDKSKEWMDALRKMVHTGGGKVRVTKEEDGVATITTQHAWGFNMGELKVPKSVLKKAGNILPMQMVQPWTDAYGNPVEPDKMKIDRKAMEFPTQDAMKRYLKDHPAADKSKHTVKENKKEPAKKESEPYVIKDLNPSGGIFVKHESEKRQNAVLSDNLTTYDKTADLSPDDMVVIYRGTVKGQDEIAGGDFITTNKQLAKDYAGTGKIIEKKVRACDIIDDPSEPLGEEYIYIPKEKQKWVKPSDGKKACMQPLRRRRDYGEIEAEITKRMMESAESYFTREELALPAEAHQIFNDQSELYKAASTADKQLSYWLDEISKRLSLVHYHQIAYGFPQIDYKDKSWILITTAIKNTQRAKEKVENDYAGDWSLLVDMVRATIGVNKYEEIGEVIRVLRQSGMKLARRPKDLFKDLRDDGYRGIHLNIVLPNGHIGELQIHIKPILEARDEELHQGYEVLRNIDNIMRSEGRDNYTPEEKELKQTINDLMKTRFDEVWAKAEGE